MTRRRDPTVQIEILPAAGRSRLLVTLPSGEVVIVAMRGRTVRLGSGADVDVVIPDPTVSRAHCEVEPSAGGLVLRDLGSTNGTFVGGAAIKEAIITPGAVVTLGSASFVFDVDRTEADDVARFGSAVAASAAMKPVFALLERLAPTDLTITLTGETGTGKDVLARGVHEQSARAAGPFVVFDCGAVTATLIESELFGHEKGSFTGAVAERAGAFERAHGGTLFLDEVGELPLDLQPRLLRALEQRTVRRVGAGNEIAVDVRVIAATNRDLSIESGEGRFRQDLYFRLNAAVVQVPPLRERPDDLPLLVETFLAETGTIVRPSQQALATLRAYDWPGNVRELRNVLTTALAMVEGSQLELRHLMFPMAPKKTPAAGGMMLAGQTLEALERAAIAQTLDAEAGNRTRTAKALGIAPSTLYEKLKKYGL